MSRATRIIRKGRSTMEEGIKLLKVLRAEISHELSNPRFQDDEVSCHGDFVVDWDSTKSKDVVLRRKSECGEEVVVSALLNQDRFFEGTKFPWEVLMKVCVSKPGLSSILQFDCKVSEEYGFDIYNAWYLQSHTSAHHSAYRGPMFRELDPELQNALNEYLISRGVGKGLADFLLLHLHKKDQNQYMDWLHKLESMVGKSE